MNEKLGTYEGRFELDPKVKPATFDFSGKGPNGRAVEFLGIYELARDEFHLYFVETGGQKKRPDSFKTEKEKGRVLHKFRREGE